MGESRIDRALARIDAAMMRMETAQKTARASQAAQQSTLQSTSPPSDEGSSARVMELVNAHEKLREEVADTLSDLDALIGELEE